MERKWRANKMNFFVKNLLVIFFIGLVISITPGFAVRTGDALNYDDTNKKLSDLDKKTDELDIYKNELNEHVITLNESVNFVKLNSWKFWKYREVKDHINRIITESCEIKNIADQTTVTAKDIESDSNKLNVVKLIDSLGDKEFLKEVENRTNTTFDITDPINFKKGDIVQYKSEKGNSKYLEYVEIDNKTSYIILQNSAHKKIALTPEFFNKTATLKISPKTPNPQIINTIYDLQLEQTNTTKKQALNLKETAEKKIKSADKMGNIGFVIAAIGCLLCAIGAELIVIGFLFPILMVVGGFLMILGAIFMSIGVTLVIVNAVLLFNAQKMSADANKVLKDVDALESDLGESLNSFPYATDMNLTTTAGIPVNGTLNGTDFDNNNLTYTIVEQPKNGKLNTTQNGSFIYTPNNNFTGNETFKYKVNDGNVDSNTATVNITVLTVATKIVLRNVKGKVGDRVNITATLQDNNGKGIANETITFIINNKVIGKVKTNEKGIAVLNYLLRDKGKFTLSAIFAGNNLYTATNCTSLITIESKK